MITPARVEKKERNEKNGNFENVNNFNSGSLVISQ